MKIEEALIKAKSYIINEDNWIKGVNASQYKDVRVSIDPTSPHANCFCANGAVIRAFEKKAEHAYDLTKCMVLLRTAAGQMKLVEFNDRPETTHEDVMNMFDKAIEAARKKGV